MSPYNRSIWNYSPTPLSKFCKRHDADFNLLFRTFNQNQVTLNRSNPESQFYRSPAMARIEAVLLVAGGPLALKRLVQVAMISDAKEALQLIQQLNDVYHAQQSPFVIELLASGYQLLTRANYAFWLNRLHNRKATLNLSTIALETLTIIAYKQPVTRAAIEKIRGVHSAEVIKQLMERGLVRIAGTEDSLGRPFVYETTPLFLESFGYSQLDELPGYQPKKTNDQIIGQT